MQIDYKEYDPSIHDKYRALTLRQPLADRLTLVEWMDDGGEYHAECDIIVKSRATSYTGDLLICSSAYPVPGYDCGVTCGFVELYGVRDIREFSEDDWRRAGYAPGDRRPSRGYGWLVRNPRPVVEMPIKGKSGFYWLVVPKGDITEYPRGMKLGDDGWRMVRRIVEDANHGSEQ